MPAVVVSMPSAEPEAKPPLLAESRLLMLVAVHPDAADAQRQHPAAC